MKLSLQEWLLVLSQVAMVAMVAMLLFFVIGLDRNNKISKAEALDYNKSMESYHVRVNEVLSCDSFDAFDVQEASQNSVYDWTFMGEGPSYKTLLTRSNLEILSVHTGNEFYYCRDVEMPKGHRLLNITVDGDGGNGYEHFIEVDQDLKNVKQYVLKY